MTGKREKTKRQNRAVILQSARQCLLDDEYENVTVRDIIRGTGLASGTFYNYFEDKPSVFNALLDDIYTAANTELRVIRRSASDSEELITRAYRLLLQMIDDDPTLLNFALNSSLNIGDLNRPTRIELGVKSLEEDLKFIAEAGIIPNTRLDYLAAYLFGQGVEVSRMYAARRAAGGPSEAESLTAYLSTIGYQGFSAVPIKMTVDASATATIELSAQRPNGHHAAR